MDHFLHVSCYGHLELFHISSMHQVRGTPVRLSSGTLAVFLRACLRQATREETHVSFSMETEI